MNHDQQAFLSCTTRVGFDLKLSRPMMEFLCACSDDVEWDRRRFPCLYEPDNWIATERALTKRGLLRRRTEIERKRRVKEQGTAFPIPYCLTEIGHAVVAMLKVGGLFIEAEAAREKLQKRGQG